MYAAAARARHRSSMGPARREAAHALFCARLARVALCAAGEERTLRRMILERRLAPFYRGEDEPGAATDEREECPICMLFYPGGLNRANCCGQGLCSECWLQICPRANKQVK